MSNICSLSTNFMFCSLTILIWTWFAPGGAVNVNPLSVYFLHNLSADSRWKDVAVNWIWTSWSFVKLVKSTVTAQRSTAKLPQKYHRSTLKVHRVLWEKDTWVIYGKLTISVPCNHLLDSSRKSRSAGLARSRFKTLVTGSCPATIKEQLTSKILFWGRSDATNVGYSCY